MPTKPTTQPARVAIYLRISKDPDGTQTATERQRQDCEAWVARNGADLIDVYEDVDLSAFSRKVVRPEFERLLKDVKAKRLDGVLAWKVDRIARRQRDFVRLDEACEDAGAFIVTTADGIDTRSNRLMAELLVSFARQETENMSLRIRRRNAQVAEQGKPHAGGRRPFGYTGGTERTIVPCEATLVREAAGRVLDGESLNKIAIDWNSRGVRTVAGNEWAADGLSAMLRTPTITGRRAHLGSVHPERGWEPIITDSDAEKLAGVLATRSSQMHGPRTKHLLTGIARCGVCDHPLWGSTTGGGLYRCPRPSMGKGCGGVVRRMAPLEAAVRDVWLTAVASDLMQSALENEVATHQGDELSALAAAVRDDEDALERLAVDHYAERRITAAEFYAARDAINARLEPNRARLEQRSPSFAAPQLISADAAQLSRMWDAADTYTRRLLILAIVDHVVVLPAGKGHRFDPTQLRIVWRY